MLLFFFSYLRAPCAASLDPFRLHMLSSGSIEAETGVAHQQGSPHDHLHHHKFFFFGLVCTRLPPLCVKRRMLMSSNGGVMGLGGKCLLWGWSLEHEL